MRIEVPTAFAEFADSDFVRKMLAGTLRPLVTVDGARALWGVSHPRVSRLCSAGKVFSFRAPTRARKHHTQLWIDPASRRNARGTARPPLAVVVFDDCAFAIDTPAQWALISDVARWALLAQTQRP